MNNLNQKLQKIMTGKTSNGQSDSSWLMTNQSLTKPQTLSLLQCDKIDEINQGGVNKLLIGDNLDALNYLLANGYQNKIDIIYIDPPYSSNGQNKSTKASYKNNYSRRELLDVLRSRLQLAFKLLTKDGVFFCSIDDHNYAYVKILIDEIFGEEKFVNTIIWQRHTGGGLSKKIITGHDYILVYRMSKKTQFYAHRDLDFTRVKTKIINGKEYYYDRHPIKKVFGNKRTPSDLRRYVVWEELNKEERQKYQTPYYEIFEYKNTGQHVIGRYYLADLKKLYSITGCESGAGIDNFIELGFKKDDFSFPKPVELMKKILFSNNNPNSLILDFFAGSGTTGQAVLELNKEDGGQRKFILCTNTDGNGDQICIERLRRVMTGKTSDGQSNFPWLTTHQPLGSSLDIYCVKDKLYEE